MPARAAPMSTASRNGSQAPRAGEGARHAHVADALAAAREQAQAGDRILVFGSFHTAAAALALLNARD